MMNAFAFCMGNTHFLFRFFRRFFTSMGFTQFLSGFFRKNFSLMCFTHFSFSFFRMIFTSHSRNLSIMRFDIISYMAQSTEHLKMVSPSQIFFSFNQSPLKNLGFTSTFLTYAFVRFSVLFLNPTMNTRISNIILPIMVVLPSPTFTSTRYRTKLTPTPFYSRWFNLEVVTTFTHSVYHNFNTKIRLMTQLASKIIRRIIGRKLIILLS